MARTINEEHRDNRRKQIIKAATRIFAKNGFSESTIKGIAKEAGISHASIFLYFANKDDLFQKVILEHLDEAKEAYQTVFNVEGTPILKLRNLMEGQIKRQLQNTNFVRLIQYVVGYPERFPTLTDYLNQFVTEFIIALRTIIEEGQSIEQIHVGNSYYIAMAWFSYISGVGMSNLEYSEECCKELVNNGLRIFVTK